jgi:hypothetical protein
MHSLKQVTYMGGDQYFLRNKFQKLFQFINDAECEEILVKMIQSVQVFTHMTVSVLIITALLHKSVEIIHVVR